jgi:hypothetical protein
MRVAIACKAKLRIGLETMRLLRVERLAWRGGVIVIGIRLEGEQQCRSAARE